MLRSLPGMLADAWCYTYAVKVYRALKAGAHKKDRSETAPGNTKGALADKG